MPLRDHFRSPVNDHHHWSEVHGQWPGEIVRTLFDILPPGFQAAPTVLLGSPFEVDVNTNDLDTRDPDAVPEIGSSGPATLIDESPTLTVEAELSEQDAYEVRIYDVERGRQLVAAIEIVSPSNKDRPEKREVFIGKVISLLQQGVCVSIVDLVTILKAKLYGETLQVLGRDDPAIAATPQPMYAVTMRSRKVPTRRRKLLDAWFYPMIVGQQLPTLPIWSSPERSIMLPLETSYQETCRILGIA